jgi:tRNA U34 2-thiouridine synthase MnmA/TrmU
MPADTNAPHDPVNHPHHYTNHPSGIECITITEHMGFNLGNAVKYIWRADLKDNTIQDLEKARWYLDREIAKRNQQLIRP